MSAPDLEDTLTAAEGLLGDRLVVEGVGGTIVETEAYLGKGNDDDPASHANNGRTDRTAPMFAPAGTIYVYRSYGIHHMFNIVTEQEDVPGAVLVRAIQPIEGLDVMRERRGMDEETALCDGPGKLTQALGIDLADNATTLGDHITVEDGPTPELERTGRIGISKGTELPYRFVVTGSPYASR